LTDLEWSPDSKWIALNGYREDSSSNTHIYLINATDGKATKLDPDDTRNKGGLLWSPDSKWISYYTNGPKKNRIESTLWEADLTDFMNKMEPGTETGYTTDFDFKTPVLPVGGIAPDGTFTDTRDGHVYGYKNIGTQTWMAENLAYLPEVSPDSTFSRVDKRYYVHGFNGTDVHAAKNTENYQKFGVLYNWKAAVNGAAGSNSVPSGVQGACPAGWHLPGDAEWMVLEKNLGMSSSDLEVPGLRTSGAVEKKLKSPLGWDDDDIFIGQSGFNALPAGIVYGISVRKSTYLNFAAYFWTSTPFNDASAGDRLVFKVMLGFGRNPHVPIDSGQSVRCVKDL
jgi:uncharacterized protein (TIGR02145 family)